jgi:hypothetical protein
MGEYSDFRVYQDQLGMIVMPDGRCRREIENWSSQTIPTATRRASLTRSCA